MNIYVEIDEAFDDIGKDNSAQQYTTHFYQICYNIWKEIMSKFVEW